MNASVRLYSERPILEHFLCWGGGRWESLRGKKGVFPLLVPHPTELPLPPAQRLLADLQLLADAPRLVAWGSRSTAEKMRWVFEHARERLTSADLAKVEKLLGALGAAGRTLSESRVAKVVKGAGGKFFIVLTVMLVVTDVADGKPVMQATIDNLAPVDTKTVEEYRKYGVEILDEALLRKKQEVQESTDDLLREITNIPPCEKQLMGPSDPGCEPPT